MSEEKEVKKVAPKKKANAPKVKVETPEVESKTETKVEPKKVEKKLTNDTEIEVMNNTTGKWGYLGRSGFAVSMTEYGDVIEIPFGELKRMKAEQKRHLEAPFIVILDEDAVKELRYEKLYEGIVSDYGLEELLGNPDKLEKVLPKMPETMKETTLTIARRKFNSGELNDLSIKKVLESNLKIKIDI